MVEPFEVFSRRGGGAALEELEKFFMGEDRVHVALRRIVQRLEQLGIPYVVAGGMALVAHGYRRSTVDVDMVLTTEGLKAVHDALEGLGYVAPFAGSKNLRDVDTGVRIDFLVAGQYPGDGKPKPISFPDPRQVATEFQGIRYVPLPQLLELKLASGMTDSGRVKDLGDVQELIRELNLPLSFGDQLHEYVRPKYNELWNGLNRDSNQE